MNIKEAVARACEFESLSDALTSIALWETERIVEHVVRNTKEQRLNPDGSLYETFWGKCFDEVLAEHPKVQWRKKDAIIKDALSKIDGIDGIFRSHKKYFIVVKEHGLIRETHRETVLFDLENKLNTYFSIRAHQGRDMNEMFAESEKIWVRGE